MSTSSLPAAADREWIKIGRIGKAHGLLGGFHITESHSLLVQGRGDRIVVGKSPLLGLSTEVRDNQTLKQRTLLFLEAFVDRNAVEAHRGESLWALDTNESPHEGFIGMKVFDRNKSYLGTVRNFCNYGASDIAELHSADGLALDIPFVDEYCVVEQSSSEKYLRLKVSKDVFSEFWRPLI